MIELTFNNDSMFLSQLIMCLEREDVDAVTLETYPALVEGSIGAIQCQNMAANGGLTRARFSLQGAKNL